MTPSPTQSNVLAALRSFLLGVLPSSVGVYQAQQNRVPEPQEADFVIMTPLRNPRLATNVDGFADVQFTGAITLAVLTVSAVLFGVITPGATLFGTGVALNTIIGTQIAGTPGGKMRS